MRCLSVLQGEIYVSSMMTQKEHSEYLGSSGSRVDRGGSKKKGGSLPKLQIKCVEEHVPKW
jgi:hypothetical protein